MTSGIEYRWYGIGNGIYKLPYSVVDLGIFGWPAGGRGPGHLIISIGTTEQQIEQRNNNRVSKDQGAGTNKLIAPVGITMYFGMKDSIINNITTCNAMIVIKEIVTKGHTQKGIRDSRPIVDM